MERHRPDLRDHGLLVENPTVDILLAGAGIHRPTEAEGTSAGQLLSLHRDLGRDADAEAAWARKPEATE